MRAGPRHAPLSQTAALLNAGAHVAQLHTVAGTIAPGSSATVATGNAAPPARLPSPSTIPGGTSVVQRYVTLGREPSGSFDLLAKETKKKLMTAEEVPGAVDIAISQVAAHEEHASGEDLSAPSVSKIKGLAAHMQANRALIEAKLLQWVQAPGETQSTMIGSSTDAQWRQYDTYYELGLALGHETLPDTLTNVGREEHVADTVNRSEWIEQKLGEIVARAGQHMDKFSIRHVMDMVESVTTGSYNLADLKGKPGRAAKKVLGAQSINEKITDHITTLHDMMERWSSSQAGSMAAKLHETVGIAPLLGNPREQAMEATMLDSNALDTGEDTTPPKLKRAIRLNTMEDEAEAEDMIVGKRMQNVTSKNAGDRRMVDLGVMSQKHALKKAEKRNARMKQEYPTYSDHRDDDLINGEDGVSASSDSGTIRRRRGAMPSSQSTSSPPPKINTSTAIPERNLFAQQLMARRIENENHRRTQAKAGQINKTSKAKGRKNVGTRDEMDPDTLLSRLFSAPIWAGRSMTTARMMQLVEMLGGDESHKTAVAYALFAYWRRTYNKGLTPIHTFHETMDVAHNFGVPYEAFHYPMYDIQTGDIDYMSPRTSPMTGTPGLRPTEPVMIEQERPTSSSGLRRVNRSRDDDMVTQTPSGGRAPRDKEKWD